MEPRPSATGYQLQLATSSTFRDNGILYDNAQLLTPVDAPPLTLPWINGSPVCALRAGAGDRSRPERHPGARRSAST